MDRRTVFLEDWQREAELMFGPDSRRWRFKCPSCGHVQTKEHFESINVDPRMVDSVLGYSCIGRWNRKIMERMFMTGEAIWGKVVGFGDMSEGWGCDYSGDGSPNISPTMVVVSPGEERPMFGWDEGYACSVTQEA